MAGSGINLPGKWKSETFTSSGTFNVPVGVDLVFVELWGGGAGGNQAPGGTQGSGNANAASPYVGPVPVTSGGTVSVTIGSGGAGYTLGVNAAADPGTDSQFGSFFSRGGKVAPLGAAGSGTVGDDSIRATGGTIAQSGGIISDGGNAGHGNGGNGNTSGSPTSVSDAGLGAGGGGGANYAGAGGDGICIVYYKEN